MAIAMTSENIKLVYPPRKNETEEQECTSIVLH